MSAADRDPAPERSKPPEQRGPRPEHEHIPNKKSGRRTELDAKLTVTPGESRTKSRHHIYVSPSGEKLLRVTILPKRGGGKKGVQEHWDGESWETGAGGHRGLLYRRDRLEAKRPRTVWIAEGEKDVESLEAAGKTATTNLGGAGKWIDAMSAELSALGVKLAYVVRDLDEPGEKHALKVAASLRAVGIKVRHMAPAVGNDVSDHLAAGLPVSDLSQEPPTDPSPSPSETGAKCEKVAPGVRPAALQLLLNRTNAKQVGESQWEARCPAHDDRSPSLSIALGTDRPVVATCHAGCSIEAISDAVGIALADFSRLPPADEFEASVREAERRMRVQEEARRRVNAVPRRVVLHAVGETLVDALAAPTEVEEWAVEGLLTRGGNALLAALMKAGKTTLAQNLSVAWADDEPFLGRFAVTPLVGRIAYLDYELSEAQAIRWWRDLEIKHPERIVRPLFLRGDNLPFWEDETRDELAAWLRDNEVERLIVDPAARAMRPLVDDENSNSQVAAWTDSMDALKKDGGVSELVVVTHFGKGAREEDEERARGASRLEDWADSIWYLSKERQGDARWLRALGRDVEVAPLDLQYDSDTRRLTASGQSRDERRASETHLSVLDALAAVGDGASTRAVVAAITGLKKDARDRAVLSARECGLLRREYEDGAAESDGVRPGQALKCFMTESGRRLQGGKVDRSAGAET